MNIGETLKELRKKRGLKQFELAEKLGAFEKFEENKEPMLKVIGMHKDETFKIKGSNGGLENKILDEAKKVWKFYQEDFIRDIYFRADGTSAVLMLECRDVDEAKHKLSELPLVSAGLIDFDLIPLIPYPGFSRLFAS